MVLRLDGNPQCDSCGKVFDGTLAVAQVMGWGYWTGQTMGGSDKEHVICRDCRIVEHKRPARQPSAIEDEPMF